MGFLFIKILVICEVRLGIWERILGGGEMGIRFV